MKTVLCEWQHVRLYQYPAPKELSVLRGRLSMIRNPLLEVVFRMPWKPLRFYNFISLDELLTVLLFIKDLQNRFTTYLRNLMLVKKNE